MVTFRGVELYSDERPDDALLTILKSRPNLDHVAAESNEEYLRLANLCPLCLRSNEGVDGRGEELIYADDDHPVGWYCFECGVIAEYIIG